MQFTKKRYPGGSERILLVDDEPAIVEMEKQMLTRLGYDVTARTSSLEAREAFRADPFKYDLVITDMEMPNMSGEQLAAELVNIRPDVLILLCTGFGYTVHAERAAADGVSGFLMKPVAMEEIAEKLRTLLDGVKPASETSVPCHPVEGEVSDVK